MSYSFYGMKDKIQQTYRTLENESRRNGIWIDPSMIPNDYVSIAHIVNKIIENVACLRILEILQAKLFIK